MPDSKKGFTDSFKETLETIKNKAQNEGFVKKGGDLLLYVVLVLGIILTFVSVQWGAILVGIVVGVTFSEELVRFFKGLKAWIEAEGMSRSLVLGGAFLFLIIALPGGVIATLLALLIKSMIPSRSGND